MVYGALSLFSSIFCRLGDLLGDILSLVLYVLGFFGEFFSGFLGSFLSLICRLGYALFQGSVGVPDEPFGVINGFLGFFLIGLGDRNYQPSVPSELPSAFSGLGFFFFLLLLFEVSASLLSSATISSTVLFLKSSFLFFLAMRTLLCFLSYL